VQVFAVIRAWLKEKEKEKLLMKLFESLVIDEPAARELVVRRTPPK
jgi:hypothetical protein